MRRPPGRGQRPPFRPQPRRFQPSTRPRVPPSRSKQAGRVAVDDDNDYADNDDDDDDNSAREMGQSGRERARAARDAAPLPPMPHAFDASDDALFESGSVAVEHSRSAKAGAVAVNSPAAILQPPVTGLQPAFPIVTDTVTDVIASPATHPRLLSSVCSAIDEGLQCMKWTAHLNRMQCIAPILSPDEAVIAYDSPALDPMGDFCVPCHGPGHRRTSIRIASSSPDVDPQIGVSSSSWSPDETIRFYDHDAATIQIHWRSYRKRTHHIRLMCTGLMHSNMSRLRRAFNTLRLNDLEDLAQHTMRHIAMERAFAALRKRALVNSQKALRDARIHAAALTIQNSALRMLRRTCALLPDDKQEQLCACTHAKSAGRQCVCNNLGPDGLSQVCREKSQWGCNCPCQECHPCDNSDGAPTESGDPQCPICPLCPGPCTRCTFRQSLGGAAPVALEEPLPPGAVGWCACTHCDLPVFPDDFDGKCDYCFVPNCPAACDCDCVCT